ncbi:hemolysin family protein [Bacillus sp. CECT 9360]|uniref:hemolysin family protein n=1 Tax=Bacillus sp. CECT 9360 TaxID=2845821 RepID=UPI001E50CB97|nr:hemolysin family protein [Bacillus sp. CECT 9360]CAH0347225.1 hypothetical protein BCI9360_03616 [Bacillus sp. CECT 9360]
MDIAIKLVMVVILIALTAFFVASEFAIVKVRSSRINQLVEEGHRNALAAKKVTTRLDEYLSACRLGITVTALGLGWLGEPTVEQLFRPLFERMELNDSAAHLLSFFIAFFFMTYIHVVVGELAPKTAAIQKAEQITLLFAKPLILFYRILFPFIWVLNGSARVLTGLFGLKPASEKEVAHSEEELRMILSDSYESGEINQSEFKYVNKIFEFDERIAKEIMVPRTAMITIEKDIHLPEIIDIIQKEKFTRYPVTDGDKDNVIGMVNIKTLYIATITEKNAATLKVEDFMTPIIRVLEKSPIHDLLLKMQKEGTHMAILSDEYGGTAGLVTVEDILEEIVGEIRDEFDQDERPLIQKLKENHYIFDAKMLIHEVSDTLGIEMPEQDIDTLGGWILTEKSDVQMDDVLEFGGYLFKVKELDGHHILYVEVESIGSEI